MNKRDIRELTEIARKIEDGKIIQAHRDLENMIYRASEQQLDMRIDG